MAMPHAAPLDMTLSSRSGGGGGPTARLTMSMPRGRLSTTDTRMTSQPRRWTRRANSQAVAMTMIGEAEPRSQMTIFSACIGGSSMAWPPASFGREQPPGAANPAISLLRLAYLLRQMETTGCFGKIHSLSPRPPGPVTDFKNNDPLSHDAISDQVGRDHGQLPTAARDGATAIGMVFQGVAGRQQALAEALRCQGPVLTDDVGNDGLDIGQRPVGPDYFRHENGAGCGSGVPRVFSHSRTRACGTTRPASASASAAASARRSALSSTASKIVGLGSAMAYCSRDTS
jgi:hypothetical protein